MNFLRNVFAQNGYSSRAIEVVIKQQKKTQCSQKEKEEEEDIRGMALLPFCAAVTNRISKLLWRHNIKTVSCPLLKVGQCLRLVKDPLGLAILAIYKILCAAVGQPT